MMVPRPPSSTLFPYTTLFRSAAGGGEVVRQPASGTRLDALEGGEVALGVGGDVERPVLALEEHAVGGVEGDEVELLLHRAAEEREEALEDLGHEVPGRAGVEAVAAGAPAAGTAPELRAALQQLHPVAVSGEQGGARQAGDPAADDDGGGRGGAGLGPGGGGLGHRTPPSRAARSTMRALTASGTRIRLVRIRAAGVARSLRDSSLNRAWASHTARRLPGGSWASAAWATRRSSSTSSSSASRREAAEDGGSRAGTEVRPAARRCSA